MADNLIFGPFDPNHPNYAKAFDHANWWLTHGNATPIEKGQTVTISSGQLDPSVEQTFLGDKKKAQPQQQTKKPTKQRKAGGRWGMLNDFCDIGPRYYTTAECWVWMVIFRGADGNSNRIKFGVRSMAEKAGVGKNTADRAVRKFVKDGLLICVYKSRRPGTPSEYRLTNAVANLTEKPSKPR